MNIVERQCPSGAILPHSAGRADPAVAITDDVEQAGRRVD
ncbi:hypothetical protein FHS01_001840 [Longimicrobium terrae]|uniref:Uncharacterized protein n=1 Tax=Longimicrobium terrae TaxID=1639882 RepID=A0A841GSH2_9BACT|nr:hypothetical protein [Longimicrobium terrae]MBB6070220.1 hypothetical protein [Longimicrobium terrae]